MPVERSGELPVAARSSKSGRKIKIDGRGYKRGAASTLGIIMYVCICNAITERMLKDNPELVSVVGNSCGKCKENKSITKVASKKIHGSASQACDPQRQNKVQEKRL